MLNSLTTADGLVLHVVHSSAGPSARGTIVVVHGLGEHSGRYAHVFATLNAAGWNVVSYDHRGHGRSQGERGRLADTDSLLSDLALVLDLARAEHFGPLMLLGHSLGGLVVARFVAEGTLADPARWFRPVDALVLSSPALDIGLRPAQRMQLTAGRWLAPDLAVPNGLKPEWVSSDPKVVADYIADPLVHDRVTPRLVSFLLEGGEFVRRQARVWNVPTLLLFAGSDRCVAPAGSREFAAAAPAGIVTAHEYPAMSHEIFNEPARQDVLTVLGDWVSAR